MRGSVGSVCCMAVILGFRGLQSTKSPDLCSPCGLSKVCWLTKCVKRVKPTSSNRISHSNTFALLNLQHAELTCEI